MYSFTRNHPPLLKVEPDIRAVPEQNLREVVGVASWETQAIEVVGVSSDPHRPPIMEQTDVAYVVKRERRWSITDPPTHFAEDMELEVIRFNGYKLSEKQSFEQSVGIEVKAGGPTFSADVKAALKWTTESTQEWREEET